MNDVNDDVFITFSHTSYVNLYFDTHVSMACTSVLEDFSILKNPSGSYEISNLNISTRTSNSSFAIVANKAFNL